MKIVCLVGMPGSGKSLARRIIRKKFKVHTITSGDIVRKELKKRKWELTPETDLKIHKWFHTKGREILISERTWNRIKRYKKDVVIVDGFRSLSQMKHLEKLSGTKPTMIAITAPFKIRAERELKRKRMHGKESIGYIRKRDRQEAKDGLTQLIRKADYNIDNSGSKKELEKKLVRLMKKMKEL